MSKSVLFFFFVVFMAAGKDCYSQPAAHASRNQNRVIQSEAGSANSKNAMLDMSRQLVELSGFKSAIDSKFNAVEERITSYRKRKFCTTNAKCVKIVDDFEKEYIKDKAKNRELMMSQYTALISKTFTQKEIEWLLVLFKSNLFNRYEKLLTDKAMHPAQANLYEPKLEKLVMDVDRVTNPSLNKSK